MSAAQPSIPKRQRLKFIDLARSFAILLMLEGHFVGLTLSDASRCPGHPVYEVWNFLRGFTAPLFFTVAGMIFVYLLSGEKETPFRQQVRVRKGLRRALELLFWGYLLQITVRNIPDYLQGRFETWVFAFHVLQCIGVGLLLLIGLAGLHRQDRSIPLAYWYGTASILCLACYLAVQCQPADHFLPAGWHPLIQNMIHGPRSVFPIVPWLAFAFLGGAMGAHLRSQETRPATGRSCVWFFGIAGALQVLYFSSIALGLPTPVATGIEWFTQRSFQVVLFLGVLRCIEIRWGIRGEWLLRAGRETFAIYILHVILLYGGIFGVGLNDVLEKSLPAWQATLGALVFLSVFILQAHFLHAWKSRKKERMTADAPGLASVPAPAMVTPPDNEGTHLQTDDVE